ncbi:MAG TPA: hypothetical protein VNH11_25325 [Pirellulales bacterium]|nr:hypothetical protein [Pirellulales bacterium]
MRDEPSRRPLWRWHRTTGAVAIVAAAVLILMNAAPGTTPGSLQRYGDVYGWPHEFLNRDTSRMWLFRTKGRVVEFRGGELAFDLAIALAIILAAGALCEYRCRHGRKTVWQFTVNEMLVAELALGAGFAWIVFLHRWQDAALERLRCSFDVRYGLPASVRHTIPYLSGGRLKPLDRVISLHIMGGERGDDYFEPLRQFRDVERLEIEADFTDGALKHVAWMTNLVSLKLQSRSLTGDGLGFLTALPRLRSLQLSAPNLSEKGVRQLSQLGNVGLELELRGPTVTAAHLEILAHLRVPWRLTLSDVRLDNEALASLGRLRNLEMLMLDAGAIDDASLLPLERLSGLVVLRLTNPRQISPKAYERLRARLPGCQVLPY